ncbi:hypothetical protein GG804_19080 [Sphingomonas histidinilytica]|nr:hypothetical protein [Rhizorhabdus histidinilytica]
MVLGPQADLFVDPRWARGNGTFGADPARVSALAQAFVEGVQHGADGVQADGVAAVVKHWAGYGATPHGFDATTYYGREIPISNAELVRHMKAFDGSFAAQVAAVMPTYAAITGPHYQGKPFEPVGAAYNQALLAGMLRHDRKFDGLIISDWLIAEDCAAICMSPTKEHPHTLDTLGMPWGVQSIGKDKRFAKAMNAGVDQFGGADDPALLLAALSKGLISKRASMMPSPA